ncbi:MAG: cytochrome c peroxidase [Mesorhizobium sp.]
MSRLISASSIVAAALALGLAACSGQEFSQAERETIASLSIDRLGEPPADPSNRVFADSAAAAFGETLFSETGLSGNGAVSCATCHQENRQFQDDLPRGQGIGETDRRTMPLAGVAWSSWQFWDGRADTLWSQALFPLEDARDHGGTRLAYAHFIKGRLAQPYEALFGPLPDLSGLPASAGPTGNAQEQAAWTAIPQDKRSEIDTVFANLGKSLAAFQRTIRPPETRFDLFARALATDTMPQGDAALSETELLGLRLFIGRANCVTCHNGPRFTDDHFHNTGVPQAAGLPEDLGRSTAIPIALANPFNCLGRYSDAAPEQCGELRFLARDNPEMVRAFKTASLRGAVSRPPYMHSGQIGTIGEVIDHYAAAPLPAHGTSELLPITLSEREKAALAAFLGTLNQPAR